VLADSDKHFNEQNLLLAIIRLISTGWVSASHFDRMARDFGIPAGPARIYFFTGLSQILREIPHRVFEDDAARTALLESLQNALDEAIAQEESDPEDETSPH
jgi:type III secretion system TyeA family effector delivery regulator